MDFLKPYYPHEPISSVSVLAKALGVHPKILRDIASKVDDSYTHFQVNGSSKPRLVSEPKYELKKLQKRINYRIFEKVEFPNYLQGGITGRDYVGNASSHARAEHLVNLDIKNFYTNIRHSSVHSIFKYFFKFPDEVCDLLSKIVTLNDRVPQGACTSSYIANLVFFNNEYHIVSELESRGIKYSRLLDDITLSSNTTISPKDLDHSIKLIAGMCHKHSLKFNNSKKRIETRDLLNAEYTVTGLWVGHGTPKLRKNERRFIRQLVYICEKEYEKSPYSEQYNKLWNRTSGKVAKLQRLRHSQAKQLRRRLSKITPLLDEIEQKKVQDETRRLIKLKDRSNRIGHIKRVNKCLYRIGLLSRVDKPLAKKLRSELKAAYPNRPTHREYWDK